MQVRSAEYFKFIFLHPWDHGTCSKLGEQYQLEAQQGICSRIARMENWLKEEEVELVKDMAEKRIGIVYRKKKMSNVFNTSSTLSSGRVRRTRCQILVGVDAPVSPVLTRSLLKLLSRNIFLF